MKAILSVMFVIFVSGLVATHSPEFTALQKDLGIQAAQYQNSPEHQALKQQRDTRNYSVGDTKTFWRWNLSVMPPTWIQTPSTCRAVGAHSYIFVANSEWNVHITQANVDTILTRLEENTPAQPDRGAIQMDIDMFGPIPDELDNDPRLIVFYSALGSFNGSQFDGYFSAYNQVTEAEAQQMNPSGHSNECEMIYMTCYPLSPVAPVRMSVLAHELQHLIHWGQDANEDSWLDEGCAELAMVAYGVPDPISGFPSNPDNSLNVWNQSFADYVKVMLFFTYLWEHYDSTGLIADLVVDPANGMASLTSKLALHYPETSLETVISNWSAANVVDDPSQMDGALNYTNLDLPNFTMTNMNIVPDQTNLSVSPYATDYLRFTMQSSHSGFLNLTASADLNIKILVFNDLDNCMGVLSDEYTSNLLSTIPLPFAYYVVVLTNTSSSPITYSYQAGTVANDDPTAPVLPMLTMTCYPNPMPKNAAEMKIKIQQISAKNSPQMVKIYNQKGQLIRILPLSPKDDSSLESIWDGKDSQNRAVPAGMYLLRYQDGDESVVRKAVKW